MFTNALIIKGEWASKSKYHLSNEFIPFLCQHPRHVSEGRNYYLILLGKPLKEDEDKCLTSLQLSVQFVCSFSCALTNEPFDIRRSNSMSNYILCI